ncbi:MAG: sodium:solute symporter [Ignavibacteriaceae bacterium]
MPDRSPDYIIIAVYLISIALFGIITGGKQKSIKDYFLGSSNVPWWVVCFSIVAAETSTLTFISIPGLAYLTNLNFLQLTFGFLLGRIIIALFFLPAYFRGELKTAYTFLEHRFGNKTRSFASVVFLFTRTAADGVRLFATAIPLYLLLDIEPFIAILIIALVSLIYTYTGGLKGVIWADAVQMFIYLGGAVIAGIYIINYLPEGFDSVILSAGTENKFSLINLNFAGSFKTFFSEPYTLLSGLIGGAFLSMASHGTDQLIVQRLLATGDVSNSRKAVIGSGVIVIIQFSVFLMLGVLLYAFYGKLDIKSDEIFPMFIIKQLPVGVSGIIIAGLFAAAMSTIAGSISSLSSSTMHDLYIPLLGKFKNEKTLLIVSRIFTVIWTIMLILSALFFMNSSRAVVELALSIASFTYGGLLGTFILGIVNRKANQKIALIAFSAGIIGMIIVVITDLTAWTWYTLIGVSITLTIGYFLTFIQKFENN